MVKKKKRAHKYDTKLAINGTFADVIGASVSNIEAKPKKVKQKSAKPRK